MTWQRAFRRFSWWWHRSAEALKSPWQRRAWGSLEGLTASQMVGRVYITGTGRAGTTFLVDLLTRLGLDTGLDRGGKDAVYFADARAGLEKDIFDRNGPEIIKNPRLCDQLDAVLGSGIAIRHILIPIRDFASAAASRRFAQREATGSENGRPVRGGLWDTRDGESQEAVLHEKFATLMEAIARNDIPFTLLSFPRFAKDGPYLFEKLRLCFPDLSEGHFLQTFEDTARPELIHKFGSAPSSEPPKPTVGAWLRSKMQRIR